MTKCSILLFVALVVVQLSACSSAGTFVPRREKSGNSIVSEKPLIPDIAVPPWQLWTEESFGIPSIGQAEEFLRRGQLDEAVRVFRETEASSKDPRVQEEAFLRRIGTLLKMGRSREVLDSATDFLARSSKTIEQAPARLAVVVAFAYWHQGQPDQTLAWLNLAFTRAAGKGAVARRALSITTHIVASIPKELFVAAADRWQDDPYLGPIFRKEAERRRSGAEVERGIPQHWFLPGTYLPPGHALPPQVDPVPTELPPAAGSPVSEQVVGVLLPLTGQYAPHAERVKEGIELAAEHQSPGTARFVYFDSLGDAASAAAGYEDLSLRQGASVVLGPLLVKDSELVAERARSVRIPFLTFTKQAGIPELGPETFRLGATNRDQVDELVGYAREQLAIETFSVLFPNDQAGKEFADTFSATVAARGGQLIDALPYDSGSPESMSNVVRSLREVPKAIFVPASLDSVQPLLAELKSSVHRESVLLGPALWSDPVAVRGYAATLEGAVYVTPFSSLAKSREVTDFIEKFRVRYQREPELLAAQGYDAAMLALKSIANSGGSKSQVMNSLASADVYRGVTGKLSVNSEGDFLRRMEVFRVYRGESIEVMSAGEVTGFVPNEQTPQTENAQSDVQDTSGQY